MKNFSYCVTFMFFVYQHKINEGEEQHIGKPTQKRQFIVICDDNDAEDDDNNEKYEEMSNEGENEDMFFSIIDFICLCCASVWKKNPYFSFL